MKHSNFPQVADRNKDDEVTQSFQHVSSRGHHVMYKHIPDNNVLCHAAFSPYVEAVSVRAWPIFYCLFPKYNLHYTLLQSLHQEKVSLSMFACL